MKTQTKLIPNSLREIRIACRYTQAEAAEIMDLDTVQLSKWENGEHAPNLESALLISAAYQSTVDRLFKDMSSEIRRKVTPRREAIDDRKRQAQLAKQYPPVVEPISPQPLPTQPNPPGQLSL